MEDDDNINDRIYRVSPGDMGVIAIAVIFFFGTLYLFIGPSPFASLMAAYEKPPPGEVSVSLPAPSSQKP